MVESAFQATPAELWLFDRFVWRIQTYILLCCPSGTMGEPMYGLKGAVRPA